MYPGLLQNPGAAMGFLQQLRGMQQPQQMQPMAQQQPQTASPFARPQPSFQQNPIMGQLPSFGGFAPHQAQGLPQFQMPQQPATGQMQPMAAGDPSQHHHGLGGILPYLGFGLLGGSLLSGNMGAMAPMFGIGGMLAKKGGLFK